jgi:hypothetical protein
VMKLTGDSQGNQLGVGMEIVKGNDTALGQNQYLKYEFNGTGLAAITPSSLSDFPDLDQKEPTNIEKITTYISNTAQSKATASDIAKALTMNQGTVSKILQRPMFTSLPKEGKERPFTLAERGDV